MITVCVRWPSIVETSGHCPRCVDTCEIAKSSTNVPLQLPSSYFSLHFFGIKYWTHFFFLYSSTHENSRRFDRCGRLFQVHLSSKSHRTLLLFFFLKASAKRIQSICSGRTARRSCCQSGSYKNIFKINES